MSYTNPPSQAESRVTIAREKQGLSKEKLAILAGTSVSTVDRIERGLKPDPVLRQTLADALHVSVADLSD